MTQEQNGKCGTSAIIQAYSHMNQLSADVQEKVVQTLQRLEKQKSRISPSGRFRVHYDTTGGDAPALITSGSGGQRIPNTVEQYIDSVAFYFDSAWKLEIDTLGYPSPPGDGAQGGGPEYDVYVYDQGTNLFGATYWSPSTDLVEDGPRQRYSSYIEIDNDFLGYRTPGIDALRITAAHEFYHAIQVGSYGIWTTVPSWDKWFLELSSVWMEHVAFPGIHDYWFDAPNYFQRYRGSLNQSLAFNSLVFGGYERAVWAYFLEKRFGTKVMKDIWAGIKSVPPIRSMAVVLPQYGTSLESEYALFGLWNYFTADRADPLKYYDEGKHYPRVTPNVTATFSGLTASISSEAPPWSTQVYQFALPSDTIVGIIGNVDIASAEDPNASKQSLQLILGSTGSLHPYQRVANGQVLTFQVTDPKQWRTQYLLASTGGNANAAPDPSPNPLRLARDLKLILPIRGATGDQAEISFLNAAIELVFSRQYPVKHELGNSFVDVPSADLQRSVPTGVYFVFARCGDSEFKWKVAIVR